MSPESTKAMNDAFARMLWTYYPHEMWTRFTLAWFTAGCAVNGRYM